MGAQLTSLPDSEWERVNAARDHTLRLVLRDGVPFDEFKMAAAACYAAIGKPAPAVVVAPSPLVALAWSAMLRQPDSVQLAGQLDGQLRGQLRGQLGGQLAGHLADQLAGQLSFQLYGQLGDQLDGQLYGQLYGQLGDQLDGQLDGQLGDQLDGQLYGQLYGQLGDQLDGQLDGQLGFQLYGQLDGQLGFQLYGQLAGQLYDQLAGQLGFQLYSQLSGQLGDQLDGQLYDQLRGQLYDQLRGQLAGVHWSGWRCAWTTHWLHINTIPGITPASDELVNTLTAYRTFCTPTFTIPLDGVVIGLGPHTNCTLDAGLLHNATGTAWSWPTGETIHAWHGTRVPEWVINAPTVDRIMTETNTEIRRCAIESYGWGPYLDHLGVTPIDTADDPGNPGHTLELYDIPKAHQPYDQPVRLLVMRNASLDRDGTRRTFAETVPATISDAITAAAWQFDCDPNTYRTLQRAT